MPLYLPRPRENIFTSAPIFSLFIISSRPIAYFFIRTLCSLLPESAADIFYILKFIFHYAIL